MSNTEQSNLLFAPLNFGNFSVNHRIVMAPLTRFRATKEHIPSEMAIPYYGARAATPGTLIISEATFIDQRAGGLRNVPGIWNDKQIKAWRKITDEVHKRGSIMYLQLWALGRGAYADVVEEEGIQYVSASPVPLQGGPTPREMTIEEIEEYKNLYGQAAENAIAAGFDGVEIHAANGYLLDQFIQDVTNHRTDAFGGSIENRARFPLEVVQTIVDRIGADRTGIRFSPFSTYQEMKMSSPVPQFQYLVEQLASRHPGLSYVHFVEPRVAGYEDMPEDKTESLDFARRIWSTTGRPFLVAGGFTRENALKHMSREGNENDLIAFGRHFISNPDLVERVQKNIPFTPYDRALFYNAESPVGYLDYPTAQEQKAHQRKLNLSLD